MTKGGLALRTANSAYSTQLLLLEWSRIASPVSWSGLQILVKIWSVHWFLKATKEILSSSFLVCLTYIGERDVGAIDPRDNDGKLSIRHIDIYNYTSELRSM